MAKDSIILATGLSCAMGRHLREALSGSKVWAIGRSALSVDRFISADLSQPSQALQRVQEVLRETSPNIVGFVHLAGIVFSDYAVGTTLSEWQQTLAINLESAFLLAQVAKGYMTTGASVVFMSSVDAVLQAAAGPAAAYGASKGGLESLTRHLAQEWGRDGIRVNAVRPGALSGGMGPQDRDVERALCQRTALGRLGHPKEVAAVIAFLLGVQSSYITGAVIPVDGGIGGHY